MELKDQFICVKKYEINAFFQKMHFLQIHEDLIVLIGVRVGYIAFVLPVPYQKSHAGQLLSDALRANTSSWPAPFLMCTFFISQILRLLQSRHYSFCMDPEVEGS